MADLDLQRVARPLASLPDVVAVALGGSRARGSHRANSDWDIGLYYRGCFDAERLRDLGFDGTVSEPHEWAHFMNGGAFLTVDGCKVDVLYRDLDEVDHWRQEAAAGRFALERVPGYLVGMPSYVLLGELACAVVLHGELPRPDYPTALAKAAPVRWRWERDFALTYAEMHAERNDAAATQAALAAAKLCEAHARLSARSEWVLNEKGLLDAASIPRGLSSSDPAELRTLVEETRSLW